MPRGKSTGRENTSADGESAQATILKIWESGTTEGGDSTVGLLLEIRPAKRPAYQAQTKLVYARSPGHSLQPGQVISVKIDPSNPGNIIAQMNNSRGRRSL